MAWNNAIMINDNNIKSLKFFGYKRYLKALPSILREGETIEFIVTGFCDDRSCIVAVTNFRIVLSQKYLFNIFGGYQAEIPYKKVSSLSYKQGILFGKLYITSASAVMRISRIPRKNIPEIYRYISQKIELN